MTKILIAGESWTSHTIHIKGFDTFTTSKYEEGVKWFRDALEKNGIEVDYIPNHLAPEKFPTSLDELKKYDAVFLSDIGSNTLLLTDEVFAKGERQPNRCDLLKEYVMEGGSFVMIGGYMSFTGIDAKTRYGETSVKDILPVSLLDKDDRQEMPHGVYPQKVKDHKIFQGIDEEFPHFLGYNKTVENDSAGEILAEINGDPFIAVGKFGLGKSLVFTSDFAPHWGPKEFVEWKYYDKLWCNIVNWLAEKE